MENILEKYSWVLYILQGAAVTLEYSIISLVIGLLLGLIVALMRLNKNIIICNFGRFYVSIIRGTPVLLQLSIVYFALPGIVGFKITPFTAGIIAFSINSSGYVAEIIRAGILSVDKGQFEAAKVLGIPKLLALRDIILPQAVRNIFPALINEAVVLVKESSLIAVIGVADLMRRAQVVAAEQYTYFTPLLVAGACYYFLVLIISYIGKIIEVKLHDRY